MSILKKVPSNCTNPHRASLELVRSELKARFLERDEIIDGMLAALLSKQHALLLGPPGTAKSALINALTASIDGATYFGWQMSRFTLPDELFGPISLAALQQDRVARITTGKLPEAHVIFLDEVFKSNSAVLNALLTVVNERVFFNDGKAVPCPLVTLVCASNELPDGAELEALFDRLLLRFWVSPLTEPRNVRSLLTGSRQPTSATMTMTELETCQAETMNVAVPDSVIDAVIAVKAKTEEAGFKSSDRRWRQVIDLLRARAYVEGDDAVSEDHLDVLADATWRVPKDRPALAAIVGSVGNPMNVRATEILDAAKEALVKLGTVDARDVSAKAEWLKSASLVESRLDDMETELSALVKQHPKRNLRRMKETLTAITGMKSDITRRVAQLYRL